MLHVPFQSSVELRVGLESEAGVIAVDAAGFPDAAGLDRSQRGRDLSRAPGRSSRSRSRGKKAGAETKTV